MNPTYVIVPGYTNSGPEHWQSYVEKKYSNVIRVQQDDWESPSPVWVKKLEQVIAQTAGDLVLLGHSCGAVAMAQWAVIHKCNRVKALLLVAPADIDAEMTPEPLKQQRPLPNQALGYKSLLIHSDNDEFLSHKRALELATIWGCETCLVHNAGHIHTAAGYGDWPAGEDIFQTFTEVPLIKRSRVEQDV